MRKLMKKHAAGLEEDLGGIGISKTMLDMPCAVENEGIITLVTLGGYSIYIFKGIVEVIDIRDAVLRRILKRCKHIFGLLSDISFRVLDYAGIYLRSFSLLGFILEDDISQIVAGPVSSLFC